MKDSLEVVQNLFVNETMLYVKCIAVAILSWLMASFKDLDTSIKTSQSIGVPFSYKTYFDKEIAAIAMNFVAMVLVVFFIDAVFTAVRNNEALTLLTIGSLSFGGASLINSIFSRYSKDLKSTMIKRSHRLDQREGTESEPTKLESDDK